LTKNNRETRGSCPLFPKRNEGKKFCLFFFTVPKDDFRTFFEKTIEIKNLGFTNEEVEDIFNETSLLTEYDTSDL
jgi:hypothetical protein